MPSKKELEDKLEDNNLDLSMMALEEVPVKEISALRRGTIVDLSNNKITLLHPDFVTLKHIVKLDLSKNQLKELPSNFGEMKQLKYLDLYSNQLHHLPLSFCQLRNLRWLDLKNNPLVPALLAASGDCLDANQCQTAAKEVVKFMQNIKKQVDEERARKLEEKAREAEQLTLKEKEKEERVKQEKKAAKERRKAEMLARKEAMKQEKEHVKKVKEKPKTSNGVKAVPLEPEKVKKSSGSFFRSFLIFLIGFCLTGLAAVALTLWFYTGGSFSMSAAQHALPRIQADMKIMVDRLQKRSMEMWEITLHYTVTGFNLTLTQIVKIYGVISEKAVAIWKFLTDNSGDTLVVLVHRTEYYCTLISKRAGELWEILQKEGPLYMSLLKEKVWALAYSANTTFQNFMNSWSGKT